MSQNGSSMSKNESLKQAVITQRHTHAQQGEKNKARCKTLRGTDRVSINYSNLPMCCKRDPDPNL